MFGINSKYLIDELNLIKCLIVNKIKYSYIEILNNSLDRYEKNNSTEPELLS